MKITIFTTAFCLIATAAQAGGEYDKPTPQGSVQSLNANRNTNLNDNRNRNVNRNSLRNKTSASSDLTVNNTLGGGGGGYPRAPDVLLGSVSGGNPCGLGAGVGGSGPQAGGLLQWMWEGNGCQRNEDAKLLYNLGYDRLHVKNRLCEGADYRNAFAYSGDPCPVDVQRYEKAWRQQGYHPDPRGGWSK